ncbi:ImmA/IrrE family metallo-endopeptidase [Arthrobacter sp. zg-Y859]|uniref:ImmA/IrrE family metallo-endopeptidase n=1 Tax=Arthrobacter jinronghuae TaxID=2964609 RepID=A0ABT1NV15_9MICC|nr:ImmA/IrrE family metallo-endopeptidase [Arthrobacter jinronghuae]MCQ1951578.1 ImmA/IrrE family metallo-endopeptidase [Arthrobacter jinronghuae]UWX79707.1 ImmA/IrrE family metallo-endopeptidase [Arthrobacter jinronghuae]
MHLDLIAADLGVGIREGILPGGWWGAYSHQHHSITLLPGLPPIQYRSTLAHELGHAHYRHRGSIPKYEWQASVWAARQLIDHDRFMAAVLEADRVAGVASILEVMPTDVDTYVRALSGKDRRHLQKQLSMAKAI